MLLNNWNFKQVTVIQAMKTLLRHFFETNNKLIPSIIYSFLEVWRNSNQKLESVLYSFNWKFLKSLREIDTQLERWMQESSIYFIIQQHLEPFRFHP